MDAIIEYILSNYTWILIGSIIILLAVIGWYADKTNFGQGENTSDIKNDESKNIDDLKEQLGNKKLLDEINGTINKEEQNISDTTNSLVNDSNFVGITNNATQTLEYNGFESVNQNFQNNVPIQMNFDPITGESINNNIRTENKHIVNLEINDNDINQSIESISTEEELEKFEKDFNDIIPEKEIIDEGLLEDIENLTLDKTQKLDLSAIPDLDDVDLPRIKKMKTNDEGIWKF